MQEHKGDKSGELSPRSTVPERHPVLEHLAHCVRCIPNTRSKQYSRQSGGRDSLQIPHVYPGRL